jgi:hypothetical protein
MAAFEKGHGQYIVESTDGPASVFDVAGIPHVGESRHGNIVTAIQVERLTKMLWLVSLTVDPVN